MSDCILRYYDAHAARVDGKELTITDKGILVVSDPLVHVEFQFSARYGSGISFSFTMRGELWGGRHMNIHYTHPERWVNQVVPMTNEQEDRAWRASKYLAGNPYNILGALNLAHKRQEHYEPQNTEETGMWCSQGCGELVRVGLDLSSDGFKTWTMTPTDLFFATRRVLGGNDVEVSE
jgi:hypothetical protein